MTEQRLLPALALSLQNEPGGQASLEGFDFTPGVDLQPRRPAPIFSDDMFAATLSHDTVIDNLSTFADEEWQPQSLDVEAVATTPTAPVAAAPPMAEESQVSIRPSGLLFGTSPDAVTKPEPERPRSRHREIVFVTLAAAISGIVTLAWLLARTAPSPEVTVAAAAGATASAIPPPARPAGVASPRSYHWTSANSAVWAGDRRNAVAFELEAENSVGVWMRTVRPALIVRCSGGAIEAFVFTASAARLEAQTDDHTVQVSFDAASQVTDRWRDSEEHDALFAPDGGAFVRQLLGARVMRFGFTPHNASPVTAEFNVAGLSAILAPAARQCGIN